MKRLGSMGLVVVVLLTYINCLLGMEGGGGAVVESSRLEDQVLAKGRSNFGVAEKRRVSKLVPVENVGSVDKEALRRMAEAEGYGYKTANLQMLKALAGTLNVFLEEQGHNYRLGVPAFVGISSTAVKDFLKSRGVDIADRWQGLLREIFPDEAERTMDHRMFKDKKFPDGFLAKVKRDLVEPIVHVFKEVSGAGGENVLRLSDDKQEELDRLIQDAQRDSKRLMVRSTGKEDTDKLANAGGNETKANVMPTMEAVLDAMKEVVVSYFGEKSLIQRLGAGDATLFEEPMTPVLVQQMIGEKPGGEEELGKIPRCGVMFTEEPEGGLSRLHPDDMSKTSGISIIQASYGHNEGVVNSIVSVDTYYVDKDGNLFPVIRPKFFRLIPLEASGQLGRSGRHSDEWCYVPAIGTEEVMVLKLLANSLELYYRCPMDVEYVIESGEKKVWIVQARPIVHNPNQPKPSYLRSTTIANKIGCEAIGVAGGQLRDLKSSEHCIARATIGEALAFYQEPTTDRGAVECIVIGEHAPATSHEATTFRSELKPVVFTAKWEQVAHWLEEGKRVIVDVQRGIIAPWEGTDADLAAAVVTGWICYPIPMNMSMWPRARVVLVERDPFSTWLMKGVSTKIRLDADLFRQLRLVRRNWAFMQERLSKTNLSLIDARCRDVHKLLYERLRDAVGVQDVALGRGAEIVDGYSVATLMKETRAECVAKGTLTGEADPWLVQLMKLKEAALTERLSERWSNFVTKKVAVAAQEQRESFYKLIYTLGTVGALELWLHTEFVRLGLAESLTLETLLSECWNEETRTFMKALAERKKLLQQTDLKGVADPHKFKKVWDDFTAHMVSGWEGEFIDQFTKATNTARLAALPVMVNFVTIFDGALKEMSRSPAYKIVAEPTTADVPDRIKIDRDKGFVFKLMLQTYLAVLQQWYSLYLRIGGMELRRGQTYRESMSETDYLNKNLPNNIDEIKGTQVKDFQATPNFNVREAATGSASAPCRARVMSLEDAFTLIHQSLLQVVPILSARCGLSVGKESPFFRILPRSLQVVLDEIAQSSSEIRFLSVFFKHNEVCILYNWPLENHSAEIHVTYNKKVKTVAVQLSFVGPSHSARWLKTEERWRVKSVLLYKFPANLDVAVKIRGVTGTWTFRESDTLGTHLKNLIELWCRGGGIGMNTAINWEWVTRDNFDAFLEYALENAIFSYFYQEKNRGELADTFLNPQLRSTLTAGQRGKLVDIVKKIINNALYRKRFEEGLFLQPQDEPTKTFDQCLRDGSFRSDINTARFKLLMRVIPTILREAGVADEEQEAMLEGFNGVPFYGDVVRLRMADRASVVLWDAELYRMTLRCFTKTMPLKVHEWAESVFKKLSQAMLQRLDWPEDVAASVSLLEEGMLHPFEGSATVAMWVAKAIETNPQAVVPLMEKVARFDWSNDVPEGVTTLLKVLKGKENTASIPFPVSFAKRWCDDWRLLMNLTVLDTAFYELRDRLNLWLDFLIGWLNKKIAANDFEAAFEFCEIFAANYDFPKEGGKPPMIEPFFTIFLESLARYITTNNIAAINARALKMVIQLLEKNPGFEPCHTVLAAVLPSDASLDDEVVKVLSNTHSWYDVWVMLVKRQKGFLSALQLLERGGVNARFCSLLDALVDQVPGRDMDVFFVSRVVDVGVKNWRGLPNASKSKMVEAVIKLVPTPDYAQSIRGFLQTCCIEKNNLDIVFFLPLFERLVVAGRNENFAFMTSFAVGSFRSLEYQYREGDRQSIRKFLQNLLVSLQQRFNEDTSFLDMVSNIVTPVVQVNKIYMSWGVDSVLSQLLQSLVERERNYPEAFSFVMAFAMELLAVNQPLWRALFEKRYEPALERAALWSDDDRLRSLTAVYREFVPAQAVPGTVE